MVTVFTKMATNNSSVSINMLLSVLCLGLAMMLVGRWYFKSSLVEIKAQKEKNYKNSAATQRKGVSNINK